MSAVPSLPKLAISRRSLLAAGGALVVSFALRPPLASAQGQGPRLPGSLTRSPWLDAWIRIDASGNVTVFTGKVELGQGIKTALRQVAAEELEVGLDRVTLITADTAATPDEGYTAGSQSMDSSGVAILNAAAQVRAILLGLAAERLRVPAERLRAQNGAVLSDDGQSVTYGQLVADKSLHIQAQPQSKLKEAGSYKIIGQSLPRVDIPAKVTGGVAYVHDLRLPGMVHARVVRPPSPAAQLRGVDSAEVETLPGVLKVVRDGRYLAVVAEREYGAVAAMRALAASASWEDGATLPKSSEIFATLQAMRSEDSTILDRGQRGATAALTLEATYRRPYQIHGSIGPSCAVGLWQDDGLMVWTHSQGVYPLRQAIAEMLRMPVERVRCVHMEGAGCYGHNGADDVAADAALIARAMPGRPVRVQWMREQEHAWEPFGSAMVGAARGGLDAEGNIVDFQYEVWSTPHSTRPGGAGNLLPAWHIATPFAQPAPRPIPQPSGGGDRNAIPYYKLANARVVSHFLPEMPLRVSALRALGGYMNVFAIESFMDEMAKAAGADPVQFRLRHLEDPRARDVLTAAAEHFGWSRATPPKGRGIGIAFARYKNFAGYCAVAVEVEIDRISGRVRVVRAVAAADSGQAVNPDGIRNQIEGAILQAASWTLFEQVTFDTTRITSRDWSSYPILRFPDVPESIEVVVLDRPGQPYLGTGEVGQGPAAAAIANAVANASGVRIRDLPLTRDRVKAALGV